MRSRCPGVVWSSRRNDAARPTTRTITDIRSRWRVGSSTSWAGSTVRTRGVGLRASPTRTSSTWWLGPRRTTAACALQTQRPGVASRADLLNLTLAGPRVNRYEKVHGFCHRERADRQKKAPRLELARPDDARVPIRDHGVAARVPPQVEVHLGRPQRSSEADARTPDSRGNLRGTLAACLPTPSPTAVPRAARKHR